MLLPDDVGKGLRTIFAIQRLIHFHTSCFCAEQNTAALFGFIITKIKTLTWSCTVQADCGAQADHLMLLGSPPDMVRGALSHRTRTAHDQIKVILL